MNNLGGEKRKKKLPVRVNFKDFEKYVKPCLSYARRGPKGRMSRHEIFNHILFVLHTGIQWNQLPVKGNKVHWTNVYKWHLRWSKDGSYKNLLESSITELRDNLLLDLSILHGDGTNTVAKKGE